jgi:hypothetical protein
VNGEQRRGEKSCLSRFVAVLGFPQPTIVPCVLASGHPGKHRYEAEWGNPAAEEADQEQEQCRVCDCATQAPRDPWDPGAYPGPDPECECECHE